MIIDKFLNNLLLSNRIPRLKFTFVFNKEKIENNELNGNQCNTDNIHEEKIKKGTENQKFELRT